MNVRVGILGAGPAGLGLARQLLVSPGHESLEVDVFEAADQVGGLAASFEVEGVVFDHGSHRLHPSVAPEILEVLRDLLGTTLQRRPRNGRIALGGRFVRFPLRPLDALARLPLGFKLGLARDLAWRPSRRGAATFASCLQERLGCTLCQAFYFPMARKLWGLEPESIDAEQARRRVATRSPGEILTRMVRRLVGRDRRRAGAEFFYPDGGFGRISEALAGDVRQRGGMIHLSSPVEGLHRSGDRWELESGGQVQTFDQLFSTIPLSRLVALLRPAAPTPVLDAADRLKSRAAVLVCVVLARERWTDFDAHYVPTSGVPMSRCSELSHYAVARRDRSRTGICFEIPCDPGDEIWTSADCDLVESLHDQVARLGLPPLDPVVACHVRRVPAVYPVYDLGYDDRFAAVLSYVSQQPALVTLGRQGLFAHDNTHHALAMAWAAASSFSPDTGWDGAAWNRACQGFAEHTVED